MAFSHDPGTLQRLRDLGLSEYEAKAYLALLSRNPVTAYEPAKLSGVPTSTIYEVLARLVARGVALELAEGDKSRYAPRPSGDFLDAEKARFTENLVRLSGELAALGGSSDVSYLWPLRDRDALLAQARAMIAGARRELALSAFSEEAEALAADLAAAAGHDGLQIAVVLFGAPGPAMRGIDRIAVYPHPIEDTLQAEKGGRGISLVVDSAHALTGTISASLAVEGFHSGNRGFVVLTEDYIKHDIYIMKIVRRYGTELLSRFGPSFELLRDIYSDRENL